MKNLKPLFALALAASALTLNASAADDSAKYYGNQVPASRGTQVVEIKGNSDARVVDIKQDTRWVNVTNGDTVTFNVDNQAFTWNFSLYHGEGAVRLGSIMPEDLHADAHAEKVVVYVAPDLDYGR
jgi:hypothetical protein